MRQTDDLQPKYDALRQRVESTCGRKMSTPRDFQFLSAQIYALTNQQVSAPTLRRLWGYQDHGRFVPRTFTLNILSKYVGYKDWNSFCNDTAEYRSSSDFLNNRHFDIKDLQPGDRVRLIWEPNRCVMIKFEGIDIFVVEESVNSKLQAGNRFCCKTFIQNEPLYLERLMRDGYMPTNYVCGKIGGISFEILRREDRPNGGGKQLIYYTLRLCSHQVSYYKTLSVSHQILSA